MAYAFQIDTAGTLTTSLNTYLKLDSNSTDVWGTNNGTDTDISYVTGKVNNAADFNGTTSIITTTNDIAWTKLSFSFWVKFDTLGLADRMLFHKGNSDDTAPEINFQIAGTGTLVGITVNNTLVGSWVAIADAFTTDTWYHIIITIDEDGDTAEWFINNVSKMATATAAQTHNNQTEAFVLGKRQDAYAPLDGQIDEFAIWTKVLSSQERTDLYNGGSGQTMVTPSTVKVGRFASNRTLLGVG